MADNPSARGRWGWIAALLLAVPSAVVAQGEAQIYYTRQPEIRVPFGRDTSNRLKQVQLYVSTDMGRDWHLAQTAPPDAGYLPAVHRQQRRHLLVRRPLGRLFRSGQPGQPQPAVAAAQDRPRPQAAAVVVLRQIADSRAGIVSIEWNVQDENFDPRRFALEYRVTGTDWQREAQAEAKPNGVQSWRLEPGLRMDVRLRVADRAGNDAEQSLPIGNNANGRPIDPPPSTSGANPDTAPDSNRPRRSIYSKSMQISIGYKFDHRPISGIQVFDLWYTTDRGAALDQGPADGRRGRRSMPATPGTGGTEATVGKLIFDATTQGLHGFTPVARNGVGIGDADPRPGDPPKYLGDGRHRAAEGRGQGDSRARVTT